MPEPLCWPVQILVAHGIILGFLLSKIFTFLRPCFLGMLQSFNESDIIFSEKRISSGVTNFYHILVLRFDLIYLILDKPDEQTDRRLAKHIVALHFENAEVLYLSPMSNICLQIILLRLYLTFIAITLSQSAECTGGSFGYYYTDNIC